MRFLTHRPEMPLAQAVEYFWFYDGLTPAHHLERVLPGGAFELLINLQDEPRHTYSPDRLLPVASYRGSWLAGMHSQPVIIDTAPNSSMIGIHFRPGGAARVLRIPADALRDQVIELEALCGPEARELREKLLAAPTPRRKVQILELWLLQRYRINREDAALGHAMRRLQQMDESVSIRKLAAEIGWSHKHLIDKFQAAVGLSPKRFSRIQRFQHTIRTLQQPGKSLTLTEAALQCGYYDQAHFNSEFKSFAGLSPGAFLRAAEGRENFIPVRPG